MSKDRTGFFVPSEESLQGLLHALMEAVIPDAWAVHEALEWMAAHPRGLIFARKTTAEHGIRLEFVMMDDEDIAALPEDERREWIRILASGSDN